MELQKIIYTAENSSPELVAAILSRVRHIGDRIIAIKEVPKVSPFTAQIIFGEVKRLIADWESFDLIVDLTDSQRQDTDARKAIEGYSNEIKDKMNETVFVVGDNFIIQASITFVVKSIGREPNSKLCGSIDEGVAFIKSKRSAA